MSGATALKRAADRAEVRLTENNKYTDLGSLPADWDIKSIGDFGPFVTSGSRGWAAYYSDRGSLFIRITNLSRECIYLDLSNVRYVSLKAGDSEAARTELKAGDVLISITADIGIIGYVTQNIPTPSYINQHICLVRFSPDEICSKFVSYFLAGEQPQRAFTALTDAGAKAGLNLTTVRNLRFAVPPTLQEQEAVAEALSDADALIEGLESLIAKKRAIKQGAMQDLLTGKRRLPGFKGEWKHFLMPDVCWFQEGPGVRTHQFTTQGVKLLNGTNIIRGRLDLDSTSRFISEREANGPYSHFLAEADDIVIASSGITIDRFHEKVAIVTSQDLPLCMNTSTIRFKPNTGTLDRRFLFQFLMSSEFKRQIGGQATGSAQLNFGPSHVSKVELSLPAVDEQANVSNVLSIMDNEIAALESKLVKARHIKQGMMQELLTGRIRLI